MPVILVITSIFECTMAIKLATAQATSIVITDIIIHQVTRVQSIHEKSLIYRDIKPDNFLIGVPGTKTANTIHVIGMCISHSFFYSLHSCCAVRTLRAHPSRARRTCGFTAISQYRINYPSNVTLTYVRS